MAMVYPMQADEIERRQKLLSSHIETWGPQGTTGDGWSNLSMDSSEMGNIASPFDDIGFLAGGPGPAMDPPSPKRATEKSRNVADQVKTSAPPSLGKFLDTTKQPTKTPVDEQSRISSLSQRGSRRRLDKTISTRQMFQHDEEASLALSVALAGGDKSKANPSRHMFDFSKQSLGLSVLAPSKSKAKTIEASKTSFDTSRTVSTRSSTKGNDSSKGSFGFSTTRPVEGSRKLGSKFSSMMRSKNDSEKLSKSEQKVSTLEAENMELHKEINLLQAKMEEMTKMIATQALFKDWRSTEELAAATTEAWQFRSMSILADIQVDRLEAKIASQDRLIEAKERSICNLERVRQAQEKRIGYLEMQCLQNGIDIAEDCGRAHLDEDAPLKSRHSAGSRSDDNECSFASFQDDEPFQGPIDVPMHIPYPSPRPDQLNRSNRSENSQKEKDIQGRSSRSECSSMCLSEMSFHSQTDDDAQPDSLRDDDDYYPITRKPSKASVPLEEYLSTSAPKEQPCFETGTWDPTKTLDFANCSPRDVGVVMPPPPPPPSADHVHSAPAPSDRKTVDGPGRSKSPGTRRRLKGQRVESDSDLPSQSLRRRSKSPGTRRKLKDPTAGTSSNAIFPSSTPLDGCVTEHCKSSRRKLKVQKSDIGASSTHSLSRGSAHRRRQRKESGFDRLTVSSALEKALGASMNGLDMDDDEFATKMLPDTTKAGTLKARQRENGILMVPSKASRDSDVGLDLDDVFRD